MKKFFIILCGILIMGNAFGAKSKQEPSDVDKNLRDAWGLSPWEYNKDLSNQFMQSWMIGETHQAGACGENDEGAGLAIIATDIFSNGKGAEFCTRQIQSANAGRESWIDFYDFGYECETFCKPGFYGTKCDTQNFTGCDDKDYTSVFDNIADATLLDTSDKFCNDTSKIKTENTPVFYKIINKDNNFSQVYVLGVLEVKPHAIIVGPVDIQARRKLHSTTSSWISSVKGNGNPTVLCAAGYVVNAQKNDCIAGPSCATDEEKLSNLCNGYNKNAYKSDDHVLLSKTGQSCYYFHCKNNKGFSSANDTTCIECPGGKLAYIKDDGTCGICNKGEIANPERTNCTAISVKQQYSKDQMKSNGNRQCWLETDGRKFLGCVKGGCSGTTPCWDKSHGCKACD